MNSKQRAMLRSMANTLETILSRNREATEAIYRLTSGIPRLVNQLCDLGLVYAFSAEELCVTAETIDSVLADGVFFGAVGLGGVSAHET